jgi:DNA-binding NarL/FixJ family response regulator
VERIGVVLVDMPRILREIVRASVGAGDDFAVLAELPDAEHLADVAAETDASFVITDAVTATPESVERLLTLRPQLRVLGIGGDGRQTFLYELRPQRIPLGEMSPGTLVEVMRVASRPTTPPPTTTPPAP